MSLQKQEQNKNRKSEEEHATLPEEIAQVLEKVPKEEDRNTIRQMLISQFSMISRVSPEYDVAKKVTPEHITKMLDTQDRAMEKTFKDKSQRRIFTFCVALLSSAVLIALVVLLKDKPELMEKIVTIAFSGLLGAAGGYGIGVNKNRDND